MSRPTEHGHPNKTEDDKIMFLHNTQDKMPPLSQSNVACKFTYSGCNSLYIGKTSRTLLVCTQEHALSDCPFTGLASSSTCLRKHYRDGQLLPVFTKCNCRKFCSESFNQISEHFRAYFRLH